MRIVVYLIVFGFLFVSCAGNHDKQATDNPKTLPQGLSDENNSDTTFILPDKSTENISQKKDSIFDSEDKKPAQQEFVPTLGAQGRDNDFKNTMEYHFKRGLVLFKINNYEEGVIEFDTAIAMDPGKSKSYINRGRGLLELKRYEEACRDFEKAVNLDHRDTTSYLYLATAYYHLGKYREAVEVNTEVIILAPQKAKGYYNRGISYGLLKDYENAIADFNQAIALNPKYAEAFYNRGLAYYFLEDKKAACEDWELAKFYGNQKAVGAVEKYCK